MFLYLIWYSEWACVAQGSSEDDRKMYSKVKAFEKVLVFIVHVPVTQLGINIVQSSEKDHHSMMVSNQELEKLLLLKNFGGRKHELF